MFGKLIWEMDNKPKPKPGSQLTPSGSNSTSNQQQKPAASFSRRQVRPQTYIDQSPLNFGSQSSQSAPTLSSHSRYDADRQSIYSEVSHEPGGSVNNDERSAVSTFSYRSDLDAYRFLKEVEGRVFSALNETYVLPSDGNEWARLAKQHLQMILGLGGLYPAKETVDEILAPHPTRRRRILDLGTGSGIWAIDMAKRFPHSDVVGIDIVPVPVEPESILPNVRFELDNIELGLNHFHSPDNQFDLIHARIMASGLQDFNKAMRDAQMCLKPGGILIWIDADFEGFMSADGVPLPLGSDEQPDGCWMARIGFEAMRGGAKVGGSDFAGMAKALDEGFWTEELMDPATCRTASLHIPVGTWATHEDPFLSQRLKYVGALMRQNLQDVRLGLELVIKKAGWPAEIIHEWQRKAEEEMSRMKPPIHVRYRLAWGRRRIDPSQQSHSVSSSLPHSTTPAAPNPVTTQQASGTMDDDPFSSSIPYPYFYIYETREQALAETVRRNRIRKSYTIPPAPR